MWLIVGDLHLTDHARDAHRFGIFEWIAKQQKKHETAATFILGDITDSKDRHSATLVNKIVSGLVSLRPPVYIVKGNHDYTDPKNPFFKFLNHIDGLTFVTKPMVIEAVKRVAIIPHYRKQDDFDNAILQCADGDTFLVHQTFDGAIAESGVRLSGLSASLVESLQPPLGVYAGDVHRPQTQGLVTYVGCPYQVRFGDNFEPRCVWISKSGTESYPWFDAPRKWALAVRGPEDILNNNELLAGDQIKLTIQVAREEAVEWKQIKQAVLAACKKCQLDVFGAKLEVKTTKRRERLRIELTGTSISNILEQFCASENLPTQFKREGLRLIER